MSQLHLFGDPSPPEPTGPSGPTPSATVASFSLTRELLEHLRDTGPGTSAAQLAMDLVRLEPGLEDRQRWALFFAVVIGLEAQSQGSTFVPLPGDYAEEKYREEAYFERRLRWLLGPPEIRPAEATDLVATLSALLQRQDLLTLGATAATVTTEDVAVPFKPLIVHRGRLYHQRLLLAEDRLVDAVKARLQRVETPRDPEAVDAIVAELRARPTAIKGRTITLNDEQELAAREALFRPLTLITGGPGTGKTSIIVAILRLLVGIGVRPEAIALAAPTGKAAHRMAESIQAQLEGLESPTPEERALRERLPAPSTLHRLLGYSPRRDEFAHHRHNPLRQKMVIVDEASMIDLFLMERLLQSTAPQSNLVLLGDADQLPSVDTGAVLRDLIPGRAIELKRSYRMRPEDPAGREILLFAHALRSLERGQHLDIELAKSVDLHPGVRLMEPELLDFVDPWFRRTLQPGREDFNATYEVGEDGRLLPSSALGLRRAMARHSRAKILTLTRVFSTGSEAINLALHQAMASLGPGRAGADFAFHPGEPVMMLRNDYDRQLFNGDQGIIAWCRQRRLEQDGREEAGVRLMAVFDRAGELVAFPLGELRRDLEHSFAMTVHKAQGSEFEHVALVLPRERSLLLNRELLYTAVTRASRGVLILGDRELLERGASSPVRRFTGVDVGNGA